jgi:hypothetical protein
MTSEKNVMKTARAKSISSFTSFFLVAAIKFDLFTWLPFMGRRKKIKYLTKTLFQQIRLHQKQLLA